MDTEKDPNAVALGRKGGLASKGKTSRAKAAAARRNGRKGGRPKQKERNTSARVIILALLSLLFTGCANPLAPSVGECWTCDNRISSTLPSGERIWWCEPWELRACRIGEPAGRSIPR